MSLYKQSAVTGAFVTTTLAITIRSVWRRLEGAGEEADIANASSYESDVDDMQRDLDGSYGGIIGFSCMIAVSWLAVFSISMSDNDSTIMLKYLFIMGALVYTAVTGIMAMLACATYATEFDRYCPPKNLAVSGSQSIYTNCVAQNNLIDDLEITCPAIHFYSLSGIFMWFVCGYYYFYRDEQGGDSSFTSLISSTFNRDPIELSKVYLKKLTF